MKTYIALFRGINVVGKRLLPMKALVAILEKIGCREVKTYIQSGNAVFRSKEADASGLSKRISAAIMKSHGFQPNVQLLGIDELRRIISANPFPEAETEPATLHVNFLESTPPNPDLKTLASIKASNERFVLTGRAFYLHAPDGIGASKLAARAERLLGVPLTSRNWRTTCKIAEIAREYE